MANIFTSQSRFSSNKPLYTERDKFEQWLIGFTEGDDCFTASIIKVIFTLSQKM